MKLLLVTQDSNMSRKLHQALGGEYTLEEVSEGAAGIYAAQETSYSLVILDDSLGEISGEDFCFQVRHMGSQTPLLVLSDPKDSKRRVSCLQRGADAWLPRSFSPEALVAQVKALLRRVSQLVSSGNVYRLGDLTVDFWSRSLLYKGKKQPLRKREFDLLELFIRNRNRVLSRDFIHTSLWVDSASTDSNVIDVSVCNLRNTLRRLTSREFIKTHYGLGYVFESPELQPSS